MQKLGVVLWYIAGILGSVASLWVVMVGWGFWGLVLGFILGPVTWFLAPFYALFAWGNWIPMAVGYVPAALGYAFILIGGRRQAISQEANETKQRDVA